MSQMKKIGSLMCASCLGLLGIFALVSTSVNFSFASAVGGGSETIAAAGSSDVFFDEGDSDFEIPKEANDADLMKAELEKSHAEIKRSMPADSARPAKKQLVKEEPPIPTEPPKTLEKPARVQQAGPVGDPSYDEMPYNNSDVFPAKATAKPDSKSVGKTKAPVAVVEKPSTSASRNPSSIDSGSSFGGNKQITKYGWQVANRDCVMRDKPASESSEVLVVKQQRKIWVEVVDQTWYRGFRKDGSEGFLNRDCF